MKFHGATWWNTISPGCPWNFNTMLTEPTRQIKTTFLMNMTYMYVIYALFCVEFILYCLKTLSIQYCRITRLFCWITFSKKIRISWNSGLLQYSTGLFTWEYISFVRTQGSVDVMEGHFFFWIFFWGGEIVTQEMGIGENCLGKPAATSYCSIWHTCTSFLFFFCEFFFEIVTMPGTSRKLPRKAGSNFIILLYLTYMFMMCAIFFVVFFFWDSHHAGDFEEIALESWQQLWDRNCKCDFSERFRFFPI